jgi:hypothetical protein
MSRAESEFPHFLSSFANLQTHLDQQFGELGNNEKGDTFLDMAMRIIPLYEKTKGFKSLNPISKMSHDKGIDIISVINIDNKVLFAQSKYKIRRKKDIDGIISDFKAFEENLEKKDTSTSHLFPEMNEKDEGAPTPIFVVITSSDLSNIIDLYEKSTLASKEKYNQLLNEERLFIIDGKEIFNLLTQFYRKAHMTSNEMEVISPVGWIAKGNVYLGIISAKSLCSLYDEFGDSLFFENIRDFLGIKSTEKGDTSVNQEIVKTIYSNPERMLERNNGITIKVSKASVSENKMTINDAAIVNGCQTTMCLVVSELPSTDCFIQTKIVEAEDAWDIAKAANYQNPVARIELDLARFLRPQLARKAALTLGYGLKTEFAENATSILNTVYQNQVNYEELKLLYLGIFSRKPNNLFKGDYSELKLELLEHLYKSSDTETSIFEVLLMLLKEGRIGLEICRDTFKNEEYSKLFKRFYNEDKPRYRAYFTIITIFSLLRKTPSTIKGVEQGAEEMKLFLRQAHTYLENEPERFHSVFLNTFLSVADSLLDIPSGKTESDILQSMYKKVSSSDFDSIVKKVLLKIDASEALSKLSAYPKIPK